MRVLFETLGFEHELLNMPPFQIGDFLERNLIKAPLEEFIGPETT